MSKTKIEVLDVEPRTFSGKVDEIKSEIHLFNEHILLGGDKYVYIDIVKFDMLKKKDGSGIIFELEIELEEFDKKVRLSEVMNEDDFQKIIVELIEKHRQRDEEEGDEPDEPDQENQENQEMNLDQMLSTLDDDSSLTGTSPTIPSEPKLSSLDDVKFSNPGDVDRMLSEMNNEDDDDSFGSMLAGLGIEDDGDPLGGGDDGLDGIDKAVEIVKDPEEPDTAMIQSESNAFAVKKDADGNIDWEAMAAGFGAGEEEEEQPDFLKEATESANTEEVDMEKEMEKMFAKELGGDTGDDFGAEEDDAESEMERLLRLEMEASEEPEADPEVDEEAMKKLEEEAEKKRLEEEEVERKRKVEEEAERKRKEEGEAEQKRLEEEAEKKRLEEEAERKRIEEEEAEKKRQEEEEAAIQKLMQEANVKAEAEEAERKQKEEEEAAAAQKLMEEEANKKREEEEAAEKIRLEEEVEKKRLEEEAERKLQEEEEKKRAEEEEEEAERKRLEDEEAEKKRQEEEEAEAEKKRLEAEAEAEIQKLMEETNKQAEEEAEKKRKEEEEEEAERKLKEEEAATAEKKRLEEEEEAKKKKQEEEEAEAMLHLNLDDSLESKILALLSDDSPVKPEKVPEEEEEEETKPDDEEEEEKKELPTQVEVGEPEIEDSEVPEPKKEEEVVVADETTTTTEETEETDSSSPSSEMHDDILKLLADEGLNLDSPEKMPLEKPEEPEKIDQPSKEVADPGEDQGEEEEQEPEDKPEEIVEVEETETVEPEIISKVEAEGESEEPKMPGVVVEEGVPKVTEEPEEEVPVIIEEEDEVLPPKPVTKKKMKKVVKKKKKKKVVPKKKVTKPKRRIKSEPVKKKKKRKVAPAKKKRRVSKLKLKEEEENEELVGQFQPREKKPTVPRLSAQGRGLKKKKKKKLDEEEPPKPAKKPRPPKVKRKRLPPKKKKRKKKKKKKRVQSEPIKLLEVEGEGEEEEKVDPEKPKKIKIKVKEILEPLPPPPEVEFLEEQIEELEIPEGVDFESIEDDPEHLHNARIALLDDDISKFVELLSEYKLSTSHLRELATHCVYSNRSDHFVKILEHHPLIMKYKNEEEIPKNGGTSLLATAIKFNSFEIIQNIIRHKTRIKEFTDFSPLHLAVYHNEEETFSQYSQLFLNQRDDDGWTPLHLATILGKLDMMKSLLRLGCAVDPMDYVDFYTPLHLSIVFGRTEALKILLEHKASCSVFTMSGFNAMHLATKFGKIDVLEHLLVPVSVGEEEEEDKTITYADVDAKTEQGKSALHIACQNAQIDSVVYLLDICGFDANEDVDEELNGHLHSLCSRPFCRMKDIDMFKVLIEFGANVEKKNIYNETPLYVALQHIESICSTSTSRLHETNNNEVSSSFMGSSEDYVDVLVASNCVFNPKVRKLIKSTVGASQKYQKLLKTGRISHTVAEVYEERIMPGPPLQGHTAHDKGLDQIVVFGGYNPKIPVGRKSRYNNDVYLYDTQFENEGIVTTSSKKKKQQKKKKKKTRRRSGGEEEVIGNWMKMSVTKTDPEKKMKDCKPAGRAFHSSCFFRNQMFVYGGESPGQKAREDLWVFDFEDNHWENLDFTSSSSDNNNNNNNKKKSKLTIRSLDETPFMAEEEEEEEENEGEGEDEEEIFDDSLQLEPPQNDSGPPALSRHSAIISFSREYDAWNINSILESEENASFEEEEGEKKEIKEILKEKCMEYREGFPRDISGYKDLSDAPNTVNGSQKMILYGGMYSDGVASSEVWSFNFFSLRWQKLTDGPPARYGHTAVYDVSKDRMLVFGGVGVERRVLNDVWGYSCDECFSVKLDVKVTKGRPGPGPRMGHASIFWDGRMYVYGGMGTEIMGDLWLLDVRSKKKLPSVNSSGKKKKLYWSRIKLGYDIGSRAEIAMTFLNESEPVIYGGRNGEIDLVSLPPSKIDNDEDFQDDDEDQDVEDVMF